MLSQYPWHTWHEDVFYLLNNDPISGVDAHNQLLDWDERRQTFVHEGQSNVVKGRSFSRVAWTGITSSIVGSFYLELLL